MPEVEKLEFVLVHLVPGIDALSPQTPVWACGQMCPSLH